MNKGEVVKFFDLQIGDYFSDNARQKYRKIPQYDLALPNLPSMVINAFHIQSNAIASVKPDDEFIFIAHATWNPEEHKEQFMFPVQVAELDHQLEFFTNYFEILNTSLQSIETSDDFHTLAEAGLQDPDIFPFKDGRIIAENSYVTLASHHFKTVSAITVNSASGSQPTIDRLVKKYNPGIETMEGATFFYICSGENIPFLALRSVSNRVEPRNKSKWNIPLALNNLSEKIKEMFLLLD